MTFRFFEAISTLIEPLLCAPDGVHHAAESAVLREFGQPLSRHQEAIANGPLQPPVDFFRMSFDLLPRANYEFGGCRGRGRTQIGDKVDNREIGLVPDGGDHRNFRFRDSPRQSFVIEGCQILG